ncbi:MAG TPA: protein kinase [Acidobacteriaceae bacterium]|jgi:serine/threonine protein kinase
METARQFVGEVVGNYRVLAELGSGGMGTVYRAEDTRLDRQVALKVLPDASLFEKDSIERFRHEARAASSLNHPNICTVYDAGEDNGIPYLAMELLEGQTLGQLIASQPLPTETILRFGIQVCDALQCAHEKGIVHRDIKPSNIFITARGDAKLLDFGVAKRLHSNVDASDATLPTSLTVKGQLLGTAPYMSPEQLQGKPVDARSDLFSLGAVFYEMATGLQAYRGDSVATIVAEILRGEPRSVRVLNPEIPGELQRIIRKALEKDPADRYQSAKEVMIDLRRAQRDLDAPHEAEERTAASGRASVLPSWVIWCAAAVLLAAIAVGIALWLTPSPVSGPLDSQQITFSAVPKDGPLLTDGSRLYFQGRGQPSEMTIGGGMIAPIPSLQDLSFMDITRDGANALTWRSDPNDNVGLGSLFVSSILGEHPRRLNDHLAQVARWFPNGQSIAFAYMGTLYTCDADGSNVKKLLSTKQFIQDMNISPDAKEMTLSISEDEQQPSRVWRMNADGTNLRPVALGWPEKIKEFAGQWTPDGKHFVFLSDHKGLVNIYELVKPTWFEFWKKPTPVRLTGNQIDIQAFVPSRDSKSLFALGRMDQGLMEVFDPGSRKFVPFLDGIAARDFILSPDGQWMVYAEYPSGHLWKSKLDGTEAWQLTNTYAAMEQWSPDGKWIAYSDWQNIYRISAEGGTPERLTETGSNQITPTWLPGGGSIAFNYYPFPDHAPTAIQILDLATHKVSPMPGTEGYYLPSWSPDGKYMVAIAVHPSRLMLYTAEKKSWRELKRFDVPWGYWTWSRDSKSIYMALVDYQKGMYRLTVPEGKWEKMSGMERVDLRDRDSFVSLTADGQPAIMSHTGVAQVYALHWNH